jgi:hypothetical protein
MHILAIFSAYFPTSSYDNEEVDGDNEEIDYENEEVDDDNEEVDYDNETSETLKIMVEND